MRRGTFFAPLTALFLLGAGCVELPDDCYDDPLRFTPRVLLEYFEYCYCCRDEAQYEKILDPDFTYILDREHDGVPEHLEWGREEELTRFAELCAACAECDMDLDLDFSESGDTEPDPGDTEFGIQDVEYTLRAFIGDTTYLLVGRADFHAVINDGDGPHWRLLELSGFERPDLP